MLNFSLKANSLNLSNCSSLTTPGIVKFLKNCTTLEQIVVANLKVSPIVVGEILATQSHLKSLCLGDIKLVGSNCDTHSFLKH